MPASVTLPNTPTFTAALPCARAAGALARGPPATRSAATRASSAAPRVSARPSIPRIGPPPRQRGAAGCPHRLAGASLQPAVAARQDRRRPNRQVGASSRGQQQEKRLAALGATAERAVDRQVGA